jgi:hypothetical protein
MKTSYGVLVYKYSIYNKRQFGSCRQRLLNNFKTNKVERDLELVIWIEINQNVYIHSET